MGAGPTRLGKQRTKVSNRVRYVVRNCGRCVGPGNLAFLCDPCSSRQEHEVLGLDLEEAHAEPRTSEHKQGRQTTRLPKLYVGIQTVADHDRPLWIEVVPAQGMCSRQLSPSSSLSNACHALRLDTVQHRALGLSDRNRILTQRKPQRCADRTCTWEQTLRSGVRAVLVCYEERAALVPEQIVERFGELRVVDGRVEPAKDRADARVRRPLLEREAGERVVLRVLLTHVCKTSGKGEDIALTVPPRYAIPSSRSSSSSPSMPIT